MDPRSADHMLSTLKPSTNEATKRNRDALIMNMKIPSVTMVIGSVRITNIGRTIALRSPRQIAAMTAGYAPVTSIPGMRYAASKSANAEMISRMISDIW